jgi:hypothetical protein
MGDRLPELSARLDDLGGLPVQQHPEVLESVHRELVGELDQLAATGSANGARRSP